MTPNQTTLCKLLAIVSLMAGFTFALVPMYRKICRATGIDDTRDVNSAMVNSAIDSSRNLTVEFVASVNQSAPLQFEPVQNQVQLHPGEVTTIRYRATNLTDHVLIGQAVPSYSPERAQPYFTKLQCFCFKNQSFQPHETREMPVVFIVGRDLPADINTLSLAYTFFDITEKK
jgi:cytochrome c oxidase assembly protein subunit 11